MIMKNEIDKVFLDTSDIEISKIFLKKCFPNKIKKVVLITPPDCT